MEASALKHVAADGLRGPTPLLRLQSDERLVALTRRGNQAAYEALVARYQARLLAFCRHMLGSREDAEDVLQEVFAAAYNAMVADERPLNVRPWLYRIARNRSLNHLRRVQAIGVDSMDVHLSENGASTADKVHRREEFRLLVQDVQGLAETQRTALLLREIDALSYEQIAEAMETTVPSVKSLLVRARVSLAESAEARHLTCEEVRDELGEVAEGLARVSPPVRKHLRACDRCAAFRRELRRTNRALAAVFPVGPLLLIKKLLLANLGTTASAGGSAAAAAGAGAASAGAGGALSYGVGAMASKAAAGLAAAAIVTAGAVEVDHAAKHRPVAHHQQAAAVTPATTLPATPRVVASQPQPAADPAPAEHGKAQDKQAKDAKAKEQSKRDAKTDATPATPTTPSATPVVAPPQQGSATVTLPDQQTADAPAPDTAADQTAAPPPPPVETAPADPPAPAATTPADTPAPTPPAGDTSTQPVPPPADDPAQQQPPADPAPTGSAPTGPTGP